MKASVPFVLVYWDDAHADFDAVTPTDAHLKHQPAKVITPGWLMLDNEEGVQIAGEYFPEDESFRAPTFIPRAIVRDVVPVTLSRKRVKQPKGQPEGEGGRV